MARKIAWGIDIGQTALRAVKAMPAGDRIEILAFDSVEYDDILSAPDVDKDNAIQQALRTFLSRNRIAGSDVVLGCIPGQSALIKFIKLPPVEKKRIPDIVRYEAHQQIPFPLEEVVWDYKPVDKMYAPGEQVEVGIFAMRRDIVHGFLSNFMVCNLDADVLQLAPMALYNYVSFDQPGGNEAQIVIDMGAENTELLITTGNGVWPRSLPVSGNDFTEAIMAKFKVPFGKAETLKRMAKQSKYSAQIYQAIEPVLRKLVDEIQRSIGFYKSINPGTRIGGIMALGGSFKLPGLGKYLSEGLRLPIRNLTEPQNFDMSMARNPRAFEESALSFGVALGLAVQGCGMARMDISLLPQELLQRKIIARKKPWGAAVAACAALMLATAWYSTWERKQELTDAADQKVNDKNAVKFISEADAMKAKYKTLINVSDDQAKLEQIKDLWTGRDFWLLALRKIYGPVPAEPENVKGVWLRKEVSETIPFDTVASLVASDSMNNIDSGVGFQWKGMTLQPGWLDRLNAMTHQAEYTEMGGMGGMGGFGGGKAKALETKEKYPDVVYVVIQGETIAPERELYVTTSFQQKLTNEWECSNPDCKRRVTGLVPPDKCPNPDCKSTRKDFILLNPPLIVDVRFKGSRHEERFVDHLERVIPLKEMEQDDATTWQQILQREQELEGHKIANWDEPDKDKAAGERLPKRNPFLARLEQTRGLRLESFTDFEIAFFLDPSGSMLNVVADKKKEAEKKAGESKKGGLPK